MKNLLRKLANYFSSNNEPPTNKDAFFVVYCIIWFIVSLSVYVITKDIGTIALLVNPSFMLIIALLIVIKNTDDDFNKWLNKEF